MLRRNWYRRLLLSYFPLFFVTITILVFLSFLVVGEISRKETAKADAISTRFMMENIERSVTDIEMTALKDLESDASYASYLNARGDDQSLLYSIVGRIRKLIAGSDLIDSIYLYRASDRQIVTHRGPAEWSTFPDRPFLEQALSRPEYRGWSQVRDMKDLGDGETTQVISMYKQLPLPFGSQGMLVINVSMYRIERIIDAMTNGSVSFLVLRDEAGQPFYQAHSAIPDGSSEAGGKVLTTLRSDRLGWTFESGIKAGQLYSWVSVISYIWIAIGSLTVVLALVYLVYITRRHYRPIQGLVSRIQSLPLFPGALPAGRDELALIDSALERLISQSRDYEKKHHENLLLQRSRLFTDLIGGQDRSGDLEERLRKVAPFPESAGRAGGYAIVLAEMNGYDRFREAYSVRDQNVLKFALMNVFQELAQGENMHSWTEWLSGRRAGILIALPQEAGEDRCGKIREVADRCRKWVEEKLHLSVGFGIGTPVGRLEDVASSFASASEALQHRLSLGHETVLVGDELPRGDLIHVVPYLTMVSELVKDFRLSQDGWRIRLQELFASFRRERLKDGTIRSLLQTLLQTLAREVAVVSEELNAQLSGEKMEALWRTLDEAGSLDELQTRVGEFLTELYRTFVAVSETKSYRAMIGEMRSYIEEHFDDPDLSLKHLSDRFHVSGKYASYLFKTEFGMKFVDFLVELRMRRAEQLLAETELPIQDIATAIGYANSITFGRVFKRTVGVTPGDYRRLKMRPAALPGEFPSS